MKHIQFRIAKIILARIPYGQVGDITVAVGRVMYWLDQLKDKEAGLLIYEGIAQSVDPSMLMGTGWVKEAGKRLEQAGRAKPVMLHRPKGEKNPVDLQQERLKTAQKRDPYDENLEKPVESVQPKSRSRYNIGDKPVHRGDNNKAAQEAVQIDSQ